MGILLPPKSNRFGHLSSQWVPEEGVYTVYSTHCTLCVNKNRLDVFPGEPLESLESFLPNRSTISRIIRVTRVDRFPVLKSPRRAAQRLY